MRRTVPHPPTGPTPPRSRSTCRTPTRTSGWTAARRGPGAPFAPWCRRNWSRGRPTGTRCWPPGIATASRRPRRRWSRCRPARRASPTSPGRTGRMSCRCPRNCRCRRCPSPSDRPAMSGKLLPHLETFAEAAERGSFTAAARRLRVSQAAVSQRIGHLETLLNVPLFRRHAGRVTLTDAGRRLHEYARRILDLSAEARAAVTGAHDEVTGELVLAASSVPGQHLLPPTLAAFHEQHPAVQVRVSVSDTDAVFRELEEGHAHLGLVGGQGGGSHLEFRRVCCDELVVVVPRGHPWWRKDHVGLRELDRKSVV